MPRREQAHHASAVGLLRAARDEGRRAADADREALGVSVEQRVHVAGGEPEQGGGAGADEVASLDPEHELVELERAALVAYELREAGASLVEIAAIDRDADALHQLAALARAGDEGVIGLALATDLVDEAIADALDVILETERLLVGEQRADGEADAGGGHRSEQAESQREARGKTHAVPRLYGFEGERSRGDIATQHEHANARALLLIRRRANSDRVKYTKLLPFASLILATAALNTCTSACSSSTASTPATPAAEAGADAAASDATPATPDAGAPDTSTAIAVRCTQAEFDQKAGTGGGDFTGFGGADISFPTTGAPAQYTNHCVKVKVGSNVTWAGSFSSHPLQPAGGDTPTPIPSQSTDPAAGAVSVVMSTAGTYGFECGFHPTIMFGAVQVVP